MTSDDLGEAQEPAEPGPPRRPVAVPPAIAPERWEDFDGFRETFLADFTVPEHNAGLRRLCGVRPERRGLPPALLLIVHRSPAGLGAGTPPSAPLATRFRGA